MSRACPAASVVRALASAVDLSGLPCVRRRRTAFAGQLEPSTSDPRTTTPLPPTMIAIHPISLGISLYLAISGFRKGSLSASGGASGSRCLPLDDGWQP